MLANRYNIDIKERMELLMGDRRVNINVVDSTFTMLLNTRLEFMGLDIHTLIMVATTKTLLTFK